MWMEGNGWGEEDETAAGEDEERPSTVDRGQRAVATTYFTLCLSLHRLSECKVYCCRFASCHHSVCIGPSHQGEMDRERGREIGQKKKKKRYPKQSSLKVRLWFVARIITSASQSASTMSTACEHWLYALPLFMFAAWWRENKTWTGLGENGDDGKSL